MESSDEPFPLSLVAAMVFGVLGMIALPYIMSTTFNRSDKPKSYNSESPLKYKVGFEQRGNLKDGREFRYEVNDFLDISEDVWVDSISISDLNGDRKVDSIVLSDYRAHVTVGDSGKLEYDESRFDEKQAQDLVSKANAIYSEAVSLVDQKKFNEYSSKIPGNPLEAKVQAEAN